MKTIIIVICGATATGKTRLAVALAEHLNTEIVSADSMQIYKDMDIGTAKPTHAEMRCIHHHMINVVAPTDFFSVGKYVYMAEACIDKITAKGKTPILCGGTGMYIDTLLGNMHLSGQERDEEYREYLYNLADEKGKEYLLGLLCEVDAGAALKLHPNDLKRVIRALEVYKITGRTQAENNNTISITNNKYNPMYVELSYENRETLYEKINLRVDVMIKNGLIAEVENLIKAGVTVEHTAMQAIGYKEIAEYLQGDIDIDAAIEKIKQESRRYAKRQQTWFRRNKDINRLYMDALDFDEILKATVRLL